MLTKYQPIIENALDSYASVIELPQREVMEAMRYSLLCGGKRLRPALTLEFYRILAGDFAPAIPAACAVEMIHTYSLIHDDLPCMDDDDLRRGRPACHVKFGEATALLAGDALLTLAFETVLSGDRNVIDSNNILLAAKELAKSAGVYGMVGGQVIDLASENKKITEEELCNLHKNKTGALIRGAALMGCILAGANPIQLKSAEKYAEALGLQFQIIDDILDVVSDTQSLGKPVGSDQNQGKTTYVTLLGLDNARKKAAELTALAIEALTDFGSPDSLIQLAKDMLGRIH